MYHDILSKLNLPATLSGAVKTSQPLYDRQSVQNPGDTFFFGGGQSSKLGGNVLSKFQLPNNQAHVVLGVALLTSPGISDADFTALCDRAWFELKVADKTYLEAPASWLLVKPATVAGFGRTQDARRLDNPVLLPPSVQFQAALHLEGAALSGATPVLCVLDGVKLTK